MAIVRGLTLTYHSQITERNHGIFRKEGASKQKYRTMKRLFPRFVSMSLSLSWRREERMKENINSRGMTLLSVVGKILRKISIDQIGQGVHRILRKEEAGNGKCRLIRFKFPFM